jgi:peptidyl-prolyl cis-trans isomerase C
MTLNAWKQILPVACGLIAAGALAQTQPAAPAAGSPDEAVAKVNGQTVTRRQLAEAVANDVRMMQQRGMQLTPEQMQGYERQVLGKMVDQELLVQAASKTKVADADKKVDAEINRIRGTFPDPKMFEEQIKNVGRTMEQVRADVLRMLTVQEFVEQEFASKIKIADDQVKAFYDQNPQYFEKPAQIRASHILILVPQDAKDDVKKTKRAAIDKARERVTTGKEDFAKVAGELSEDPGSKANGGDLGFFAHGQMVPEFDKAAFLLKQDEVSEVVTTQFGYHIIKQTGAQPAEKRALDQMKDTIARFLKKRDVDKQLGQFIETQKTSAKVEVFLK